MTKFKELIRVKYNIKYTCGCIHEIEEKQITENVYQQVPTGNNQKCKNEH